LKAVLLDDADDTTSADREAGLAELLGDDLDRGVGIEEAVPDDLAHDLVGAHIVALGAGLVALESRAPMVIIESKHLKISLLAKAELLGGLSGTEPFALAFDEHGQTGDDQVIGTNRKLAGGADDAVGRYVELHGVNLQQNAWSREAGMPVGTLRA
jgi:hypothetical protein